jgi:large subunit ribosomal protein L20
MPRVKRGTKARSRRKKILKLAKGNVGGRRRQYRQARETVEKGLTYAYRDRRVRKREFRSLWIIRLNAAAREHGLSYSQFIHGLKLEGIELDRKVLAELANSDPEGFGAIANRVKARVAA